MASNKFVGDYTEELTCPVCLEMFQNPVILECGHNYCQICIEQAWKNKSSLTCPECRKWFPVKKYTANRLLDAMVQKAQKLRLEQGMTTFCKEHKEKLTMFCKDDELLVCSSCKHSLPHFGHLFMPLSEAAEVYKEKLRQKLMSLKSELREMQEQQKRQKDDLLKLQDSVNSFEQHICSEFRKMHQYLEDLQKGLIEKLKDEQAMILQQKEECQMGLKEDMEDIQEKIFEIESSLQQNNPVTLLMRITSLLNQPFHEDDVAFQSFQGGYGEDWQYSFDEMDRFLDGDDYDDDYDHYYDCDDDDRYYPELFSNSEFEGSDSEYSEDPEPAALSIEIYKGPLQLIVWKAMKSIFSPLFVSPTLNAATAHPNLVLFDCGMSVRNTMKRLSVPYSPNRFDCLPCAVASEGFTSGKHYWEVNLKSSTRWDIGIARKSAQRKGFITLAPENGYWAVSLSNASSYEALTSPPKRLYLQDEPSKIGVYLDYEGGQLSFYDAKTMAHIYTFTCTFVGKLFPFLACYFRGKNSDSLAFVWLHGSCFG